MTKKAEHNLTNRQMVKFVAGILFLIQVTYTNAANYTVSSASDIEDLNDVLSAGDTIKMEAGTWANQNIVFEGTGTAESWIVLIPESVNSVTLTGTSTLNIYGEYLEVNGLNFEDGYSADGAVVEFRNSSSELAYNCRLTNCSITDYNPDSSDDEYKWISIYGLYNRVDHCSFSGKNNSGATMVVWLGNDTPNYTQIDHNYFGSRADLGENGGETIRIGTSTNSMEESYATVEYNVFEECDGEIEIISNKSCFNTYRYNTFIDCDGCLTLRHGNDCSVYGNYFFGEEKSSGGVRIIGERHEVYNNYFEGLKGDGYRSAICFMNGIEDSALNGYFQVKDAVVAFNTIVECEVPVTIGAGEDDEKTLAPDGCVFANNVIDKTTGDVNIEFEDTPTNMTWEGNVVNADSEDEAITSGFVFADPDLEYDDQLWRPTTSSILIDASEGEYDEIVEDVDGQDRDNSKDVGCDEYSNEEIERTPLSKEDVGPYTEEEEEDVDNSIYTVAEVIDDMVYFQVDGSNLSFSVSNTSYLPIDFMLFDLSGRVIQKGIINEDFYQISLPTRQQMLLVSFISQSKYLQSNKLLTQKGLK
jgi:poly(beta-D-mannuronate) lyase